MTKKEIVLADGSSCILRKYKQSRRIRIIIARDGRVTVTLPTLVPFRAAEEFVRSKESWIVLRRLEITAAEDTLLLAGSKASYRANIEAARQLVQDGLSRFSAIYPFPFGTVSIRNQRSRWGSCSRQGNLSFNYRVVFLPPRLAEYVIVHELCHLKEFNHSPRFWELVSQAVPEYRECRKRLRLL